MLVLLRFDARLLDGLRDFSVSFYTTLEHFRVSQFNAYHPTVYPPLHTKRGSGFVAGRERRQ